MVRFIFCGSGTGSLDENEFRAAINGLGMTLSAEDWKLVLKIADTNGDGQLSYREFEAAVRSFRRRDLLKNKQGGGKSASATSGILELAISRAFLSFPAVQNVKNLLVLLCLTKESV